MTDTKLKQYWCVEIEYVSFDEERKLHRITNAVNGKVKDLRENIFITGLQILGPESDTWDIICPGSIRAVRIYRQAHFFNADEEDKTLEHVQPKR